MKLDRTVSEWLEFIIGVLLILALMACLLIRIAERVSAQVDARAQAEQARTEPQQGGER